MGDPTRTVTERVVDDPATRATSYGDAAVQQGVRVATGGKKAPAKPKVPAAPTEPEHVRRARTIWTRVFGKTPGLSAVHLADLKTHSDKHRAQRPDVGKLHGTGFQAWTNSRREVYVNTTLIALGGKAMPDWYPEALLRHEAIHVEQFARASDRVPTYQEMVTFEASAYAQTVAFLDGVSPAPADTATFDAIYDSFEAIVTKFTAQAALTAATQLEHKVWMEKEGYLPPHTASAEAQPRPLSLYVRTTP